jgi:hypothetical protein
MEYKNKSKAEKHGNIIECDFVTLNFNYSLLLALLDGNLNPTRVWCKREQQSKEPVNHKQITVFFNGSNNQETQMHQSERYCTS